MHTNEDIFVKYFTLPHTIRSYCVSNSDGSYTVIINACLSAEMQQEAYDHELFHIGNKDYERKCDVNLIEINAHGA